MTTYEIAINIVMFISLYLEVFLLLAFLEKGAPRKSDTAPTFLPKATIIVPCYNEAASIERTVNSLLALTYPKDKLEIFVVDDGSTDNSFGVLQQFSGNPMVRVFQKENGGKHTALNLGISHAHGDIIGCLDSDSTVAPDALLEVVRAFNEHPENMAVLSSIIVREPQTLLQYMQHAEYALAIFLRKALVHINGSFVTPGPFSFFRKEVFEQIGTFKPAHNTEDLEIALRMQSNGMRIVDAPYAHVYTKTPRSLSALLRQRVRWIYGFLKNIADYRHMLFSKRFGNLGMIVLPSAIFSIFSAVFLFAASIVSAGDTVSKELIRVDTIGVVSALPEYKNLDPFYLYTETVFFITVILIALMFVLIYLGKYTSGQSTRPGIDVVLYFALYGFVAPLWLTKAVYRAALSRMPKWTDERKPN